ncbi:hypothetical protein ACI79J_16600 [Geodermatophilus sp. SYSU D01062]
MGPALLAISASEAVNPDPVREQYRSVSHLDGSLVFVAGLSPAAGRRSRGRAPPSGRRSSGAAPGRSCLVRPG